MLKQVPIYAGLDDLELETLADIAVERNFAAGEYIFWDGDAPSWLYTIATGQVKVVKYSSLGKEFIIAFFGPGEMFGEVAVFENQPYPASAVAVAPTRVLGIARQDFLDFLHNRPEVSLKIIGVLGGRPVRGFGVVLLRHGPDRRGGREGRQERLSQLLLNDVIELLGAHAAEGAEQGEAQRAEGDEGKNRGEHERARAHHVFAAENLTRDKRIESKLVDEQPIPP